MQMESVRQAITVNRAYYCLDCGKCTAVCPISWRQPEFSPRALVEAARPGGDGEVLKDDRLWECLTCGRCTQVCPSDVRFLSFVRDMRTVARSAHVEGHCSHGSTIQTWMRIMTDPDLKQDRLGWLAPASSQGLRVSDQSDTVYFVGCLPYYEVLFGKIGAQGVQIAQSAVKVLNHLGIEPIVMADERCCGHDLLWEGEVDTFQELAKLNTEMLRATGASRIVTTCAECARTLKMDYSLDMEVLHISQLLAGHLAEVPSSLSQRVTYQDPCRLGRHMAVYEAPRKVMAALGLELLEMGYNRSKALCCGTSAWTHCGATAKCIQVDRLREASATGADILVTACAKCQIHFKCAQDDSRLEDELRIEIRDLTTLVADAIA
jgi:heterodisulfide reductase subunit D